MGSRRRRVHLHSRHERWQCGDKLANLQVGKQSSLQPDSGEVSDRLLAFSDTVTSLPANTCAAGAADCQDGSVCHWDFDATNLADRTSTGYTSPQLAAGNGGFRLNLVYIFRAFKDKVSVLMNGAVLWTSGCIETADCEDQDCDWATHGVEGSIDVPYSATSLTLQIQVEANCDSDQVAGLVAAGFSLASSELAPKWHLHSTCGQDGGGGCPAAGTTQPQDCQAAGCDADVNCIGNFVLGQFCACTADATDAANAGRLTATYQITTPAAHDGAVCPHAAGDTEERDCVAAGCAGPTPCQGGWSDDTCACTADATDAVTAGTMTETYRVATGLTNGGVACPFTHLEQRAAAPPTCSSAVSCSADCGGSWSCWAECSVSCGGGTQTRTFEVVSPTLNGGQQCVAVDGATESRPCNRERCEECGDDMQLCVLGADARPLPDNWGGMCCCFAPLLAAFLALLPLALALLSLLCNKPGLTDEGVDALGFDEPEPEPEAPIMWILFLLDPSGTRHAVEVESSEWSIDTVYEKALAATGIPVQDQVLKFGGRELKHGRTLTKYGVQHGSEIVIEVGAGGEVHTRQEKTMPRRQIAAHRGRQTI